VKVLLVVKDECPLCDERVQEFRPDLDNGTLQLVNLDNADGEVADFLCPEGKCPVPFLALVSQQGEVVATVDLEEPVAAGAR